MHNSKIQMVGSLLWVLSLGFSSMSFGDPLTDSCGQQPEQCLASINERQQDSSPRSDRWWELELLKLNSLFKFHKIDELYVELRPWINNTNVPPEHQPEIALLHGKWLLRRGRKAEGRAELAQALNGFQQLNAQNDQAARGLKILNVLVLLNRFEQAQAHVEQLKQKAYDSPVFYREVYAELAHIAHKNDAHPAHIEYRRESLRWAKQVPDVQQQAIAYNNYGVALRNNGDYAQALAAFIKAVEHADKAQDLYQLQKCRLRVAEVYGLMEKPDQAQQYLDAIDLTQLHQSQVARYRNLLRELAAMR